MTLVLLIASFIIASIIVQVIRGIFMKIIGANAMFLNGKAQLLIIIVVTFFVYGFLTNH